MREFVEYVAKALVDHPDQVVVKEGEVDGVVTFELSVAPDDAGKIIGREGRTIQAIRTVLGATAAKQNLRASLELLDRK
jgi:uncharacterized protein